MNDSHFPSQCNQRPARRLMVALITTLAFGLLWRKRLTRIGGCATRRVPVLQVHE